MILITGATGHLGSALIEFLGKKSPDLKPAALVRSEEKGNALRRITSELRMGDYFNYSSMQKAMQGVDTLMFISSGDLKERVSQHTNVVNAAKEAGVKQIIYTSILNAPALSGNALGADHYATEQMIISSGIPYTFFRNTFYAEVIPMLIGNAVESGQWYYSSGGKKMNLAFRTDIAEALANVLISPDKHKSMIYEIVGPESYSFVELASAMSEASGKEIIYTDLPLDVMTENLTKAGLPPMAIAGAAAVAKVIQSGILDLRDASLEKILGRTPQDLLEYTRQYARGSAK